jgi:hypothetical protein
MYSAILLNNLISYLRGNGSPTGRHTHFQSHMHPSGCTGMHPRPAAESSPLPPTRVHPSFYQLWFLESDLPCLTTLSPILHAPNLSPTDHSKRTAHTWDTSELLRPSLVCISRIFPHLELSMPSGHGDHHPLGKRVPLSASLA